MPHTGGKLFEPDSVYAKTLRDWLEAGAPNDVADAPAVDRVELFPPHAVLEGEGASSSSSPSRSTPTAAPRRDQPRAVHDEQRNSAAIDADGLVTAGARGEAFVMARFDTYTVGSQVLVLPKDAAFTPRGRGAGQLHRRAGRWPSSASCG